MLEFGPESRNSELLVAVKARQSGESVSQKKPNKNQFYRLQEEIGNNVLSFFRVKFLHKIIADLQKFSWYTLELFG